MRNDRPPLALVLWLIAALLALLFLFETHEGAEGNAMQKARILPVSEQAAPVVW